METTNNDRSNDKMRRVLSASKLKASNNLKYRIMQQIETERALSRKNKTPGFSVMSVFSVFGIMYAFIAFLALWFYLADGKEGLTSPAFFMPVLLTSFIGGMFWMISNVDYYLLNKRRNTKEQRKIS